MRSLAIAAIVLVGAAGGCDSDRQAISRDDLPEVPADADHVVELGGDGFAPSELTVEPSELVEFRVTDGDRGLRAGTTIDTGLLLDGESTVVVFSEPGRYEIVDSTDDSNVLVVESRSADG